MPGPPRVLVVHNRYRVEGGEERSVELQLRGARARAGVEHAPVRAPLGGTWAARGPPRRCCAAATGAARAGRRGVRALPADVVHVHNMQPLDRAARRSPRRAAAGARVVLHLHNLRLFCAIGVASRDGGPCFRCRGRLHAPGPGAQLPRLAAGGGGLRRRRSRCTSRPCSTAVDRFVAPSRWAAGQLARLGLPRRAAGRCCRHYLPDGGVRRAIARGGGRLRARGGAALGGEGRRHGDPRRRRAPACRCGWRARARSARRLAALAGELRRAGRVPRARRPRAHRASCSPARRCCSMPSRYHEIAPYAAMEAMAAGVPVVASRLGGLPELVEPGALRAAGRRRRAGRAGCAQLWDDPELRDERGRGADRAARASATPRSATCGELLDALRARRPSASALTPA